MYPQKGVKALSIWITWPRLDVRGGARSCLNVMCPALSKPMEGLSFLNGDRGGGNGGVLDRKREGMEGEEGGETGWYGK